MMSDARRMPPLAKAIVGLLGLAGFGVTVLVIVGSFAGIVALVRWLSSVLALSICS
jgi:hypothetical protein